MEKEVVLYTDLKGVRLYKRGKVRDVYDLGDRLLIERFVEKKIGLFARVSRDDVQAYYNEHPDEFKGKRFSEVQKQVTSYLSQQKVGQQLDQYVEELRGRTFIRINPLREEGPVTEGSTP